MRPPCRGQVKAARLERPERAIGESQLGTKAGGLTATSINDDVGVLGLHLENLCPNVGVETGNDSWRFKNRT